MWHGTCPPAPSPRAGPCTRVSTNYPGTILAKVGSLDHSYGLNSHVSNARANREAQQASQFVTTYQSKFVKQEGTDAKWFKQSINRDKPKDPVNLNFPAKDKHFKNTSNVNYIFNKGSQDQVCQSTGKGGSRRNTDTLSKENTQSRLANSKPSDHKYAWTRTDITKQALPSLCYR